MKVSFVILSWNRYKFLDECLSALLPSIKNITEAEVIVMDNGSTDNTHVILDKYSSNPIVKIVRRKKNHGVNAYKRLFGMAKGEYIIIVDDDVLSFPPAVEEIFIDYLKAFPDYGFLALNVIQNEFTLGAKPPIENYVEEIRGEKVIEKGPTGGWCACFEKKNYNKIKLRFLLNDLNMAKAEDGLLVNLFSRKLKLKSGLIKNHYCLHACGPHYAKVYGHMDRELEKYENAGLHSIVEEYKNYN